MTDQPKPETGNPPARARIPAPSALEALMDALEGFFMDKGDTLTCREAEAVADAFVTTGRDPAPFLEAHSWGDDDPEDMHHDPDKIREEEDDDL